MAVWSEHDVYETEEEESHDGHPVENTFSG